MTRAWLGIGSNLGDRRAHLSAVLRELEARGVRVVARSSLYETEPLHYLDQGWFLNAVVEVRAKDGPEGLLRAAQEVEAARGRQREVHMGPRTADVDILLFGDRVLETPSLVLPHPRLGERLFALVPLLEIAPYATDPRTGLPWSLARDGLAGQPGQGLRVVAGPEEWGEGRA